MVSAVNETLKVHQVINKKQEVDKFVDLLLCFLIRQRTTGLLLN